MATAAYLLQLNPEAVTEEYFWPAPLHCGIFSLIAHRLEASRNELSLSDWRAHYSVCRFHFNGIHN